MRRFARRLLVCPMPAGFANVDGTMDLACLKPLTTANDFLPETIHARPEMKEMFAKLLSQRKAGEEKRILVGSAGMGKSVLFFLTALYRVVTRGQKVLIFAKNLQGKIFLSLSDGESCR
mmetsp:Transcript_25933/g.71425  ORF Transcript_25933/g.71425 Transcript_25933/m.71425 type:complete len:119 (+) Transcript_25933:528-884(+)